MKFSMGVNIITEGLASHMVDVLLITILLLIIFKKMRKDCLIYLKEKITQCAVLCKKGINK